MPYESYEEQQFSKWHKRARRKKPDMKLTKFILWHISNKHLKHSFQNVGDQMENYIIP
jgi:hypothetical protein